MSSSIALSGIDSIAQELDTISNNIANAETLGFKAGRVNFETIMAGTTPNGVHVGSTTQMIGVTGSPTSTGKGLDAAINGRGFFTVKRADGTIAYTRVGTFQTDKDGYLTDAQQQRIQGYSSTGGLGDLPVGADGLPAKASTQLDYAGNLSADWSVNTVFDATNPSTWDKADQTATSSVYDSLGRTHTITQYFVKTGDSPAEITAYYRMDGNVLTDTSQNPLKHVCAFDTTGQITPESASASINLGAPGGANPMSLTIDYSGLTSTGGTTSEVRNESDGYAAGSLTGVALDKDGKLVASYSNSQKVTVGTLALANFANLDGLQAIDNTSWIATAASGTPLYGTPGTGMLGDLSTGALEGSNADVTKQLVELMSAQRDYQANTKVITADDKMMQALMQAV